MGQKRKLASDSGSQDAAKSTGHKHVETQPSEEPTKTANQEIVELSSDEDLHQLLPPRKKQKTKKKSGKKATIPSAAVDADHEDTSTSDAPFKIGDLVLAPWRGDLHLAFIDDIDRRDRSKV